MKLLPEDKKLLLQPVHCVGYLRPAHGKYSLDHNENDNKWYFCKEGRGGDYAGVATDNPSTWKHNVKFELKKKEFSGVVVKIQKIFLSTTLGVYRVTKSKSDLYSCDYAPAKGDGCSTMAATVYFRNGAKRLVALDCIKEYEGFNCGKGTESILNRLNLLIKSEDVELNEITVNDQGDIQIENNFQIMRPDANALSCFKRSLVLNVKKRTACAKSENFDEWFNINDEDYKKIMDIMNEQIKAECGFVPSVSYGQNNFDRLVNFANFPFCPELNEFSFLFKDGDNAELEKELKFSPDGAKKFIRLCGAKYSQATNKIFLQGHREFMQYIAIKSAGFEDENIIERLMAKDTAKLFAAAFGISALLGGDDLMPFASSLCLDIKFLFNFYDEKTVAKFAERMVCDNGEYSFAYYETCDALAYMKLLSEEYALPQNAVKKIGGEGFTRYNHDLLMRAYRDLHPKEEEECKNKEIPYTPEEKQLEWQNGEYKFCLPENTNRLVDIGSKMNICVGHLYRDKAVNKACTIVYAKKGDDYELCIEVAKQNDRFVLVQRSAFNNNDPRGDNLAAFNQWRAVKEVG